MSGVGVWNDSQRTLAPSLVQLDRHRRLLAVEERGVAEAHDLRDELAGGLLERRHEPELAGLEHHGTLDLRPGFERCSSRCASWSCSRDTDSDDERVDDAAAFALARLGCRRVRRARSRRSGGTRTAAGRSRRSPAAACRDVVVSLLVVEVAEEHQVARPRPACRAESAAARPLASASASNTSESRMAFMAAASLPGAP